MLTLNHVVESFSKKKQVAYTFRAIIIVISDPGVEFGVCLCDSNHHHFHEANA